MIQDHEQIKYQLMRFDLELKRLNDKFQSGNYNFGANSKDQLKIQSPVSYLLLG